MKKTLISVLIILMFIIAIIPNSVFAIDTEEFKNIYSASGTSEITTAGGEILAVVQVIGVSVGLIFLLIIGMKYIIMSSNPNEKATIKEKLIPYVIGAIIMFGGTGMLSIIAHFAQNMTSPPSVDTSTHATVRPLPSKKPVDFKF